MNLRLLIRPVLALLLTPCAVGQNICGGSGESVGPARATVVVPVTTTGCDRVSSSADDPWGVGPQSVTEIPTRVETLRRIKVYEAAAREANSTHASDDMVTKIYTRLASLYMDAGMYEQSEGALEHAISLLRHDAELNGRLAEDLNFLGMLHVEMGKLGQAEREELEALKLREGLSDRLQLARSWDALAGLYAGERKYAIARDYARKAMGEFSVNQGADVTDNISSRFKLSQILCLMKECPSAISLLKDSIDLAKAAYHSEDYPIGIGEFLLGYAYWRSGDPVGAAQFMEQGTVLMKEQLGWGHPIYLNALGQYARFLRENRRADDAQAVERQIRQAEAVVDVRSLQTRKSQDGLAGLR
jgi:tetratricopeptide (TPR) repeat protein